MFRLQLMSGLMMKIAEFKSIRKISFEHPNNGDFAFCIRGLTKIDHLVLRLHPVKGSAPFDGFTLGCITDLGAI
jgi:hypothetical protein